MAESGRDIIEKKVANRLKKNPDEAAEIGEKVAVELTGEGGGRWVLDCSKNPATVKEDNVTEVKTTIRMSGDDLMKISKGELNGVTAFMFGKIKIEGDLNLAIKLGKVLS